MDIKSVLLSRILAIAATVLIFVVAVIAQSKSFGGEVFVLPRGDDCGRAHLVISLEGLPSLPSAILLSVRPSTTMHDDASFPPQRVAVESGKYSWLAVLPLGEYVARVSDAGTGALLGEKHFTTLPIAKRFAT